MTTKNVSPIIVNIIGQSPKKLKRSSVPKDATITSLKEKYGLTNGNFVVTVTKKSGAGTRTTSADDNSLIANLLSVTFAPITKAG